MDNIYTEITVKNCADLSRVQDGIITEGEVRSMTFPVLVDTGVTALVINDDMRRKLGLAVRETRHAYLSGGTKVECKITEPAQIYWKNRTVACNAMVIPGSQAMLGYIPLEFMDLVVDPGSQELVGAHGDKAMLLAMY